MSYCFDGYSAGVAKWSRKEIRTLDRKNRKLLTLYDVFHPKSDFIDYICLPTPKGGKGLAGCEPKCAPGAKKIIWDGILGIVWSQC